MAEQGTHKPLVGSSNLPLGTTSDQRTINDPKRTRRLAGFLLFSSLLKKYAIQAKQLHLPLVIASFNSAIFGKI